MSDFISDEIIYEIFVKSTPETLLRCRSVCKLWRSLISTPSFIAAHTAAQKPHLILRESTDFFRQVGPENYFLFNPQPLLSFDLCFRADPLHNFHIIGTVNGVICLVDKISGTTVLWNPLIHKYLYPPAPIYPSSCSSALGFGFDPSKSDLKIVRIVSISRQGHFGRTENFVSNAEVFSVRESIWRSIEIDQTLDLCLFTNRWSQCLVNGAAHWSVFLRRKRDVLLSFNFEREEFKIIELPREMSRAQVHVSKIGPLLSVIKYKRALRVIGSLGCDIWAMKVYGDVSSWCKMVSLNWDCGGLRSVLWVREDGGEMLVCNEDDELVSCDTIKKSERKLVGVRCKGDGCFADGFVGSLGLFDCNEIGIRKMMDNMSLCEG